jgi:hypothetical protein
LCTKIVLEHKQMSIFDPHEKVEFLAVQSLHYDRYAGCQYFLERVDVDGNCGLVCGEQSDEYGQHARVILPPVYHEIQVSRISSQKALYNKYAVFADGDPVGHFTLVLNAWVPLGSSAMASAAKQTPR